LERRAGLRGEPGAAGRSRRPRPAPRTPARVARPPLCPETFPERRGCCALASWRPVTNQLPPRTTPAPAMQPGLQVTGNFRERFNFYLFHCLSPPPEGDGEEYSQQKFLRRGGKTVFFTPSGIIGLFLFLQKKKRNKVKERKKTKRGRKWNGKKRKINKENKKKEKG